MGLFLCWNGVSLIFYFISGAKHYWYWYIGILLHKQESKLSPRDRTMCRVSWNLANCHATVQKLLVWRVLNKSKLWSWRITVRQHVINICTQHDAIESFSLSYRCYKQTNDGRVVYITCIPTTCGETFEVHNVEIAHVTLTMPT